MTPDKMLKRLEELTPTASHNVKWLIVNWNPDDIIVRGYLQVRGSALGTAVKVARALIIVGEATPEEIQQAVERVEKLLNDGGMTSPPDPPWLKLDLSEIQSFYGS